MNFLRNILRFITSKIFYINLGVILILIVIIFVSVLIFLKKFTHHGETLTVPDFKGYSIGEVQEKCKEKSLRFRVIDSVFMPKVEYFTVVEQTPEPLSKVKVNRMIYLTISSDDPPKVKLPNVIDVSLRQATVMLQNEGLEVGDLKYVPDIAQNVVLRVEKAGRIIKPGSIIKKGVKVNLVLGDGLSSEKVQVPELYGRSLEEAMFVLSGVGLNIGSIDYNAFVKDSTKAIIWKQNPLPNPGNVIARGEVVDVYLTSFGKYKESELRREMHDSSSSK